MINYDRPVSDDEIDLAAYTRAVWRAKWLLLAAVVGAAAIAWLVVSRLPPRFQASVVMRATTLWAVPVEPPAIANMTAAVQSAAGWERALREAGVDPAAPRVSDAVALGSVGGDNTFTVSVVLSRPDLAVDVANRFAQGAVERVRELRARMLEDAARAGSPDVEAAQRDMQAAFDALAAFESRHDVRWVDARPYGPAQRALAPDVRRQVESLRAEYRVARDLYAAARTWQADQRRLAANRLPLVAIVDPAAAPARRVGPRPARAAALAALVAALVALGAVVAWELLRRLRVPPALSSRTHP